MKLNWGKGIAFIYTAFVLFIGCMVYMAFGEKYDLVTADYYAQEIAFQSTIDKAANADQLDSRLSVGLKGKDLHITLPGGEVQKEGLINIFRPSDETMDFSVEINQTDQVLRIPLNRFTKGKYILKTEWTMNQTEYYHENTVFIP